MHYSRMHERFGSGGYLRDYDNLFSVAVNASRSGCMVWTVSSPMFEMRNVLPLIFPYPPSIWNPCSSRILFANVATSISRLFLTQAQVTDRYPSCAKNSNPFAFTHS